MPQVYEKLILYLKSLTYVLKRIQPVLISLYLYPCSSKILNVADNLLLVKKLRLDETSSDLKLYSELLTESSW